MKSLIGIDYVIAVMWIATAIAVLALEGDSATTLAFWVAIATIVYIVMRMNRLGVKKDE